MSTQSAKALGSRAICQVGLIVRDIERSSAAYADLFGMEVPEWTLTDAYESAHTEYHDQPTAARAKLAFFDLGQVSLELIEPVGAPSTWREFLETHGEGMHHIAFHIQGMEEQLTILADKGMLAVQHGDYTGGRYAYVDAVPQLGLILELLEDF